MLDFLENFAIMLQALNESYKAITNVLKPKNDIWSTIDFMEEPHNEQTQKISHA